MQVKGNQKKFRYVKVIIFIFFQFVFAQADYCSRLIKEACEPGIIDDGTGITVSGGAIKYVEQKEKESLIKNESKIYDTINHSSKKFLKSLPTGIQKCLYQTLNLSEVDQNESCKSLINNADADKACIDFITPHLTSEMIGADYSCFVPKRVRGPDHKNPRQCDPPSMTALFLPLTSNYSFIAKLPNGVANTENNSSVLQDRQKELDQQKQKLMNCTGISNESDFLAAVKKSGQLGQSLKALTKEALKKTSPFDEDKANAYMQATFRDVQIELGNQIKKMNFPAQITHQLLAKIQKVRVVLNREYCEGAISGSTSNEIKMCAQVIHANSSYYFLVRMLAHELTHQIDAEHFAMDPDWKGIENPFLKQQNDCTYTQYIDKNTGELQVNNEKFCDAMAFKVINSLMMMKNPYITDDKKFLIFKNSLRDPTPFCDQDAKGHGAGKTSDRYTHLSDTGFVRKQLGCDPKETDPDCDFYGTTHSDSNSNRGTPNHSKNKSKAKSAK